MVNWSASTDNNAVVSYDVYLDDSFHANTTETNYTIINLSTSTTYRITVLAKDKDNNMSAKSAAASATTTDGSSGGTATELFISEYVEGNGGTNKAIEIVNLTGSTVDLDGYVLKLERNGSGVWTTPLALDKGSVKSIVPGDVFVVGNGDNSAPELQPYSASNPNGQVDLVQPNNLDTNYGQPVNFNGDDAVALFKDDVLIDIIGVFGNSEKFAINVTLRRNEDITAPNTTFDKTAEWTAFPENTFNGVGSHTVTLSTNSETLNGFKMYPNPVTRNKLFFNINEKATINIYNVLGKLVQSETIENVNSSINVSKLSKGMYLLKLYTQNQSISKKFIKQ